MGARPFHLRCGALAQGEGAVTRPGAAPGRRPLGKAGCALLYVMAAACGTGSDGEQGPDAPSTTSATTDPAELEQCAIGVWLKYAHDCACWPDDPDSPLNTPECAASDCIQGSVMVLGAGGQLLGFTMRRSPSQGRFSSVGSGAGMPPSDEGTWEISDTAQLVIAHAGCDQVASPALCTDDRLERLATGTLPAVGYDRAPDGLADAVLGAWGSGVWLDVPYEP